ncbi:hypothetical protein GCM10023083_72850 [Streptomyces phyllanthi]
MNAEPAVQVRHRPTEVLSPWQEKFPGVETHAQAVVGGAPVAVIPHD